MVEIPDELRKFIGLKDLNNLPDNLKRYKCPMCHNFGFNTRECPECGNVLTELVCPLDHCECGHEISDGAKECPICGEFVCPECYCHDVAVVSRITGYLSEVGGWIKSKRQEFKDRHRVNIGDKDV